jgi:hypothetical protein
MPIANRRAVHLENDFVRLTVLPGGGHIAGLTLKSNGLNPLWDPPWPSIEPSSYNAAKHPEYGAGAESKLLAGIAGHNLCLDFFGSPSEAEASAGLTVHGEASVADWDVRSSEGELQASAELPVAQLKVERRFRLSPIGRAVVVVESVENLAASDRPVGWTQHVTLGPPFVAKGKTVFHVPATRSKVFEGEFAPGHDRFPASAEFEWPLAPRIGGGQADLRLAVDVPISGAFTTHLINPAIEQAFFSAFNPESRTLFGYVWSRKDFPWLGIWEENYCRQQPPWNGRTLTRGMEFSVSPMPETRRQMIDRGGLFGERGFRWIPARSKITVRYCLFISVAQQPAETVEWREGVVRCDGKLEIPV